jgi:chromosomal replication initiation ATPase DnaA
MIDVIGEVNEIFGVDCRKKGNYKDLQAPRQIVAYILRFKYNYPLKTIASELGLRHRSSAHELIEKAKKKEEELYLK